MGSGWAVATGGGGNGGGESASATLGNTVTSTASRSARSSGGGALSLPTCSRGSTRSTKDEPGSSRRLSRGDEDRTSLSGLPTRQGQDQRAWLNEATSRRLWWLFSTS